MFKLLKKQSPAKTDLILTRSLTNARHHTLRCHVDRHQTLPPPNEANYITRVTRREIQTNKTFGEQTTLGTPFIIRHDSLLLLLLLLLLVFVIDPQYAYVYAVAIT